MILHQSVEISLPNTLHWKLIRLFIAMWPSRQNEFLKVQEYCFKQPLYQKHYHKLALKEIFTPPAR